MRCFSFASGYYMRGGIKSTTAVRSLGRLYDNFPDLFVAEKAKNFDAKRLSGILRDYNLGYHSGDIGPAWVENARRLVRLWGGDPRNIFVGVSTYEDACKRVANDHRGGGFIGFQKKMVSMLIVYLVDAGLIEPFLFPVPVDMHVTRIVVANEIVVPIGPTDENTDLLQGEYLPDLIRETVFEFATDKKANPVILSEALWLLSATICDQNPGNQTRSGRHAARSTVLTPVEIDWSETQNESYRNSCGSCPLDPTCRWNIPSAPYYRWAQIMRRGERERSPVQTLFPLHT